MERRGGKRPVQNDNSRRDHHQYGGGRGSRSGGADVADKFGNMAVSGKPSVKTVQILANHFRVQFDPTMIILHYDVSIKEPLKYKGEASIVAAVLLSAHLGNYPIASDGQKNIYSRVDLPETPFRVHTGDGRRQRRVFTVTLQKVNELRLSLVDDYIQGRRLEVPREVMQAMDVVVKENLRRSRVLVGRFFHSKDEGELLDLKKGAVASWGVQQSLKLTKQGLILCLDYSVIPFFKPLPLLDFLTDCLKITFNPKKRLTQREKDRVSKALKGVKVRVSHRETNQKYPVRGLTEQSAGLVSFSEVDANGTATGKQVRLVQYFKEKYNKSVQYEFLPCVELGTKERRNDVPIEFCVVVPWQRCGKENLDKFQDREWKRYALAKPAERQDIICGMVKSEDGPCGGGIINSFNMSIDTEMTRVTGRVLNLPVLKVRNEVGQVCRMVPKENGQWNFFNKKLVDPVEINSWIIVDFLARGQQSSGVDPFVNNLVMMCNRMGINIRRNHLFKELSGVEVLMQPDNLTSLIRKILDKAQGKPQILICLIPDRCVGFNNLKRVADLQVGVITTCCVKESALVENNDQYLANVVLKINAKLGGSTAALYSDLPSLPTNKKVMFIGADVNHPKSFDSQSHSISAVVGTINWPGASKYAARFRIQDKRKEEILNLGQMCLELINVYAQVNGFKPEKIFLFRDGVADNMFDMVLTKELVDVKNTVCVGGYKPLITLIVSQKRHQTRLFPLTPSGNILGNVPAGTVVETTIVNKDWDNFYLSSYNGILGTSKTTHYQVLIDENKFTSGQIKEIIYNLCYLFARCTKPVSLVPPVYWADVMAYRARLYYESFLESKGSSATDLSTDEINGYLKLHPDVKNKMLFV